MKEDNINLFINDSKKRILGYKKAIPWILVFFFVIFSFKVVKTLLTEIDSYDSNYASYVKCVSSYIEYDGDEAGSTEICEEHAVVNELIIVRLLKHLLSSLLAPSIFLAIIIYLIKRESKSIKEYQNELNNIANQQK